MSLTKYILGYGIGGGYGGIHGYVIESFENDSQATQYAYELAVENYQSYEGNGGIRTVDQIMEEDEIEDEDKAEQIYNDEMESWIDYLAEIYNSDKHDSLLR